MTASYVNIMEKLSLKILNTLDHSNNLQYLPYGVTTLEMKAEGNISNGYLYPYNRPKSNSKIFVGYPDKGNDFLIIWGAGAREGLNINPTNINERLFLQVLHTGKTIDKQSLSIYYTEDPSSPIKKINLIPAEENFDIVRSEFNFYQDYQVVLSFIGQRFPLYYSRWVPPPRLLGNKKIQYKDIESLPIFIKFNYKTEHSIKNLDSDICIYLEDKKIAEIGGDWRYAWPHAELFTVFGDKDYIVLRFWLYWIHENYSKGFFGQSNNLPNNLNSYPDNKNITRNWWESFSIESPDIERFDFLIDTTTKKRIVWVGTDFHYQELWYKCENEIVKARIANDADTIDQVVNKFRYRFLSNQNRVHYYEPITEIKEVIKGSKKKLNMVEIPSPKSYVVSNINGNRNLTSRGVGLTRKHIPYIEKERIPEELISGDNRKYLPDV
jgi:hypothetical protein